MFEVYLSTKEWLSLTQYERSALVIIRLGYGIQDKDLYKTNGELSHKLSVCFKTDDSVIVGFN